MYWIDLITNTRLDVYMKVKIMSYKKIHTLSALQIMFISWVPCCALTRFNMYED